jgi:NADH:ubiquinone oxidoreductase subunit 6 (subunit J)
MTLPFFVCALLVLAGAIAAMSLRSLIHCALALAVTFAGLAAIYLQLNAQFVGLAQLLVYVGAVAILIVFAILLTRGHEPGDRPHLSSSWPAGVAIAAEVFALLAGIILSSRALVRDLPPAPHITVRQIGDQLMTRFILPLEILGLLLTAALIGAVILARREGRDE